MNAQKAAVRPRVRLKGGTEAVLLEDEIRDRLEAGEMGICGIVGGPGSGRTTALRHLAATFPNEPRLQYVDLSATLPLEPSATALVVYAATHAATRLSGRHWVYLLEPWSQDDVVEYLLATAPTRCASVVGRLTRRGPLADLLSIPDLAAPILDVLAKDDAVSDDAAAFRRVLAERANLDPAERARVIARRFALADAPEASQTWGVGVLGRFLQHRPARRFLHVDLLVEALERRLDGLPKVAPLAAEIVGDVADRVAMRPDLVEALHRATRKGPADWTPFFAGVLVRVDRSWVPDRVTRLVRARLEGARWPKALLVDADLERASLVGADLSEARLDGAKVRGADFGRACLRRARLGGVHGSKASFARAEAPESDWSRCKLQECDLSDADLEGATLARAMLPHARLDRARLLRADLDGAGLWGSSCVETDFREARLTAAVLSSANLKGARFSGADAAKADFGGSRLEAVEWEDAALAGACLDEADLSDARLPRAQLGSASLVAARMAGIDLSDADLRGADLSRVSFHLGSSRSGLIESPIASEGTRTGFYVEDRVEQSLIDPEAVRTANLRGADLRGAKLDGADFFLVDLRDAKLDPGMLPLLRGMRAILEDPGSRPQD